MAKSFPEHGSTRLCEENFPDSGRQKREKPVELYLNNTVLVDGKYILYLIFKREKSANIAP